MTYWLLKTEPDSYSYADLERDGATRWDGVKNNMALKNIRRVRKGDSAFIYHTGKEKAVVGIARITADAYQDPKSGDPKLQVFDLEPDRGLARGVTLKEIKADPAFAEFALVRLSRLSVMEVSPAFWKRIVKMAG
jgi:predicted RNA-binding protein with PUA-like domain